MWFSPKPQQACLSSWHGMEHYWIDGKYKETLKNVSFLQASELDSFFEGWTKAQVCLFYIKNC